MGENLETFQSINQVRMMISIIYCQISHICCYIYMYLGYYKKLQEHGQPYIIHITQY